MSHVDEEVLAGRALGEPGDLRWRDRWHLTGCQECAARLSDLSRIVATGRGTPAARPVHAPRPGLLAAIHAELDLDANPTRGGGPAGPSTTTLTTTSLTVLPTGSGTGLRRPRRTRWLVAAAAVAAVGTTAAVAYHQGGQQVLATAVLTPLPAKAGSGTAEIVGSGDGRELSVSISTSTPPGTFAELWLFDSSSGGMISVGIVPPTGRATFPLPAAGPALSAYTVVDVSQEPFDGNPAHSHNSILRGTLG